MGELTLATGECISCHKDVFKPPCMFKYWGGHCKPCSDSELRVGTTIATGYCLDCKIDVFKKPSEFKKWSGLCNPCARRNRRGIPLTQEARAKISKSRQGCNSGDAHWNWKGGITTEHDSQRAKFKQTTQKKVFQKDNYTCQICYQYGGNLQADHIKSWSKHPKLRFRVSNCRTLCMACHYYVTFKRKLPKGVVWGHNFSKRVTL